LIDARYINNAQSNAQIKRLPSGAAFYAGGGPGGLPPAVSTLDDYQQGAGTAADAGHKPTECGLRTRTEGREN